MPTQKIINVIALNIFVQVHKSIFKVSTRGNIDLILNYTNAVVVEFRKIRLRLNNQKHYGKIGVKSYFDIWISWSGKCIWAFVIIMIVVFFFVLAKINVWFVVLIDFMSQFWFCITNGKATLFHALLTSLSQNLILI